MNYPVKNLETSALYRDFLLAIFFKETVDGFIRPVICKKLNKYWNYRIKTDQLDYKCVVGGPKLLIIEANI